MIHGSGPYSDNLWRLRKMLQGNEVWYHKKWDAIFVNWGSRFECHDEDVTIYFWKAAVRDWSVLELIGYF